MIGIGDNDEYQITNTITTNNPATIAISELSGNGFEKNHIFLYLISISDITQGTTITNITKATNDCSDYSYDGFGATWNPGKESGLVFLERLGLGFGIRISRKRS